MKDNRSTKQTMFNFFGNNKDAKFGDLDANAYHSDFIKGDRAHQLIDVREPGEFARGHLPGAINVPLGSLSDKTADFDPQQPTIVVCASGNRSRSGASKLVDAGFSDVYNLRGGTMGWMRAGFATEK